METSLLEDVIDKAVHKAVSHMSISEVRDMVIAPYLDIRQNTPYGGSFVLQSNYQDGEEPRTNQTKEYPMPNHVTNRITGPEAILGIITRAATEDESTDQVATTDGLVVDFNLLIPEPEDNFDWYEWRYAHWGTKWNAYHPNVTYNDNNTVTIQFDTAWCPPTPIFNEISLRLPDETLIVQWADEDLGRNIGDLTVRSGNVAEDRTPFERTYEARDYASILIFGKTYVEFEEDND